MNRITLNKMLSSIVFLLGMTCNLYSSNFLENKNSKMFTINAELPSFPDKIDSSIVNSVSDYILLEHLLIPLVGYNTIGEISGVLAEKWEILNEYKTYIFYLSKKHKFSDGTLITANHVVNSIKRSMNTAQVVNYDFSNIKSVEEVSEHAIKIHLNNGDPFFLYDLEHPEFRVLSEEDSSLKNYQQSFVTTSGPYYLSSISKNKIILKKNPYYLYYDINKDSPDEVSFIKNTTISNDKEAFGKESVDLFWSPSQLEYNFHEYLIKQGYQVKVPRLGFSFWLSLNPNSKKLKKLEIRKYLQKTLKINKEKISQVSPFLDFAKELFLPNGPGRLSSVESQKIWDEIEKQETPNSLPTSLNILIFKNFYFIEEIRSKLKNEGIEVNFHFYSNFKEYAELIKNSEKFDIIQTNNDFSSIDLRATLNVTFNESRPLIITKDNDKEIKNLLDKVNNEIEDEKRYSYIERMARILLVDGYVIPLYYYNTFVYHKPHLNLEDWSSIVPDVGIWKIKKLKN